MKKDRKYSIEDLDNLIISIKSAFGLKDEEIASRLGYNEGYISQIRTRGYVPDKFMEAIKREFAKSKQIVDHKEISATMAANEATDGLLNKYFLSLERENKILERENERLRRDLEISLNEIKEYILATRAMAEVTQDFVIELVEKKRKLPDGSLGAELGKENFLRMQQLKEAGSFPYVGK